MSAMPKLNNRYELREIIGEGGMGIVYRAVDRELKRDVALKTIKELLDSQQLDWFLRECDVLKQLEHPNIVNLYDAGISEENGEKKPFFVMPFLPGLTLDKLIRTHAARLTPDRVVDIITQTARGLQAAHDIGLIHRDVKPSNIFVLNDDSVKLIDFGLVHLADQRSRTGFKGTLPYMSPEQWASNPPTPVSDVFSLAVVCYEALGRRRPFNGSTLDEIKEAILQAVPPPISELNPAVSLGVSQVVHAAMAKQPWNRTSTARQFAEELQKALHNQPIERFDPTRIEPRIARVQRALEASEYDFAAEIIGEIEAEGHIHPTIRSLRKQVDQALRARTAKRALESARHRFAESEYQLALQKVDEVLRLDSNNPQALALKNEIDSAQKNYQIENWFRHAQDHLKNYGFNHARQALQNVLRLKPTDSAARQMLTEVDRRENEYLREHREKEDLYKAALAAWQHGEVSAAFSKLERVLELDRRAPDSASSASAVSYQNLYEQVRSEHDRINNGYQEARKLLSENDFNNASSICEDVLNKYPEHPLFLALKEDIGERQRQYISSYILKIDHDVEAEPDLDRKVAILSEAQHLYPEEAHFRERLDKVTKRRDLVAAIKQKIDNLEDRGQYVEALGQLEILRAIYAQYPGLDLEVDRISKRRDQQSKADAKSRWVNQIDTALSAGDFSHSLNLLKSALADFPDDSELLAQDRQARDGQERCAEATRVFEKAQTLCAQGDLEGGIEGIRQAHRVDERNALILAVLVEMLIKRASAELDTDLKLSEELVGQALHLDAASAPARNLHRMILDRQKDQAVDRILSRSRDLQASGDANSALIVIQEGLDCYPDERRLVARKEALLKIIVPARRSERKEEKEKDLSELNELLRRMKEAQDPAAVGSIRERSILIARKHHGDPEIQLVFKSVEDLRDVARKASIPKPEPVPESGGTGETPIVPPDPSTDSVGAVYDRPGSRDIAGGRRTPLQKEKAVIFRPSGERWLATLSSLPLKRIAALAAIPLSVIVLVAAIVTYKKLHPGAIEPLTSVMAKVEINASVPGARVLVDAKDIGAAPQPVELPEGEHKIDAELTGYGSKGPVIFRVERGGAPPPSAITVALEPLPTVFRISTEFVQGSLDGEKLMLDGTGLERTDLPDGPHVLKLASPVAGIITVEFEINQAQPPVIKKIDSPLTLVVALAALKDRGQLYSSSKTLKIGLNGVDAQEIGDQARPVSLLTERNLLVLDDSKNSRTVTVGVDANPTLTVFVGAQPNVGNLEITESGKIAATVSIEPADKKGPAKTQTLKNGKATFSRLEPKAYLVEVSAPDYEKVTMSVTVPKGDVARVPVTLTRSLPTTSTLQITGGTPDADVFMDNNPIGKRTSTTGDFTLQITPGRHRVQLRKNDFEESPATDLMFTAGTTTRVPDVALKPYGWIEFNTNPASAAITYRPAGGTGSAAAKSSDAPHLKAGRYVINVSAPGYQPFTDNAFDVEPGRGKAFNSTLVAVNSPHADRPVVIGKEGFDAPSPQASYTFFRQQPPGSYSFRIRLRRSGIINKRAKWVVNYVDNRNYIEYEIDEKNVKYTLHQNGKDQSKSVLHRLSGSAGDVYDLAVLVSANEITLSSAGQKIDIASPEGAENLLAGKFGFPKDENVDMETFRFTGTPPR